MTAREILRKKFGEVATIPRDCPWLDPPDWWDKGLRAWGELLSEQWEAVKHRPKSAAQLRSEAWCRAVGQACAEEMTRMAIEVLTGEKGG